MSIRLKLIILVCLMTILPAIAVGALAYSLSKAALGSKIEGEFDAREQLITLDLSNHLRELAKSADAWAAASVMADIKIADNDLRIGSFLFNTKKSYPILRDLTVLDANRKIIASTNPKYDESAKGALSPSTIYPLDAVVAGKPAAMIGVNPEQNYLAIPIKDVVTKDGSVAGVLLAEIDTAVIERSIKSANDGKADSAQVAVLLTTADQTVTSLLPPGVSLDFAGLVAGSGGTVRDGFHHVPIAGQEYVVKSAEVKDLLPGMSNAMRLSVLQAESVAYAAVAKLAMFVSLVSTALVVIFVGAGFSFARSLSKPILALQTLSDEIIKSQDLSKRIHITSKDEIGSLGQSFNSLLHMVEDSQAKLAEYSKGLEVKVQERTKAIRTILDHVTFGLFITDANLTLMPGYANVLNTLLNAEGRDLTGAKLTDLMGFDHRSADHYGALYAQIFDTDSLLADLTIDQLPTRFHVGDRSLALVGSVVQDDAGRSTGVLFCLSDITNLVNAEAEVERNRGLIKMLSNRDSFRQFVQGVKHRFDVACKAVIAGDIKLVRRELHTIKGNMGVYGISDTARMIHHLEDEKVITVDSIRTVEGSFKGILDASRDLLGVTYGVANVESFVVPSQLVDQIESSAQGTHDANALRELFWDFFNRIRLKRARTLLGPIDDSFAQNAERLGKKATLLVHGGDTLIPKDHVEVLQNLMHLLRNALDHGIEMPDDRGDKPLTATVEISIEERPDQMMIKVADDGRGISREAVAKKAVANGLITAQQLAQMSDEDVYQLIFSEGVSTAAAVTDISGRGVGMGAVKAAVEAVGGNISIVSRAGHGTTFTLAMPKIAAVGKHKQPPKLKVAQ